MTCTFFEELLDCPVFDQFLESNHNFIWGFISGPEAMDAEAVTTEGAMLEVVMEAKGVALEVA